MIILFCLVGCAGNDAKRTLQGIAQDVLAFVNPNTANQLLITPERQENLMNAYLIHFFSPWTGEQRLFSDEEIKQAELDFIRQFTKNPGWAENRQPYNATWINTIVANMDMPSFSNNSRKAIIITNTDLRVLPTQVPSFDDWNKPGQGYPFDNLQESLVTANTPALVLQTSKDGAWALILIHNDLGWVPSQSLAYVDDVFIQQWEKGSYLAITQDNTPIFDVNHQFRFIARLGSIYPLIEGDQNYFKILTAVADVNQNASIKVATVDTSKAVVMPLAATAKNIATLANSLLGDPYGWGNMYGYRDCSATLADLFTPFGIWLPRNSSDQQKVGKFISLVGLSNAKKEETIITQGVPFLTLIGEPGHILLYIGQRNGKVYVFHAPWGLRTRNLFFREGRAIIGQTVVTPLDMNHRFINVPFSWIDKTNGMVIL